MCPVVIADTTSSPLGMVINPHRISMFLDCAFGVKVMIVTLGHNVHNIDIAEKLSMPIRAIILRVVRVNMYVFSFGSPNTAFCISILALDKAKSLASSRLALVAFASLIAVNIPAIILSIEPIPVAPSVDNSIVSNPNI